MQDCKVVLEENDQLRQQLEMSKREYLRIVEDNRDHASIMRSNKADGEEAANDNPG